MLGLAEAGSAASKKGRFDYDKPIEGIKALDRYTLQLTLKSPLQLPLHRGRQFSGAVAREVIETYDSTPTPTRWALGRLC